jgi:hypothetical protein
LVILKKISKNPTKIKLTNNPSYAPTTHGPPLSSFVLFFDKLGQKLQKAWRK